MSFQKSIMNKEKFKVKFYVNIFPTEQFDWDCLKIDVDKKVLYVQHLYEFHSSVNIKPPPKFWCFKTNGIILNQCQDEIYYTITSNIFEQIFLGIDQTVISYGQNYSGKSFMMSGFRNQYELRGIVPRFAVDLFKQLETKLEDYNPKVCVSVVDIHKNGVYDLLLLPKTICKDLKNVREVQVSSEVECLELLFKAEAQRITIGNRSYNSHCGTNVVTFTVRLVSINCDQPVDKMSKIHFVDLAGVETIFRNPLTSFKDHYNQGDANVTKTMLELYALRSKKPDTKSVNQTIHILTRYLNKPFTSTPCILICHIRPNHEDIKITLSALKFGKLMQGIYVRNPEEHSEINYDMTLQKLREEIKFLKDELLIVDLTEQRTPIQVSQERIDFVKRTVLSYLNGELSENNLLSLVNDPNLILSVIKSLHNQPILKSSVTLQTDLLPDPIVNKTSIIKQDSIKEEDMRKSSIKKVSMKGIPKGKAGKTKDTDKSKVTEKGLQSQEVQVNLIEPSVILPNLESRESLWAMFLISRPDINDILDKLNASVAEHNKKLCNESIAYDVINKSFNKTQLALNQLVTYRHTESHETYDQEGKIVVPEDEANLVQEHRHLQRDLDQSKQRLINAQFDWLEAIEKLNKEKEIIEEEFKRFCADNNFLAVEKQINEGEELDVRQNGSITEEETDICVKQVYCNLQRKYLRKIKL